MNIKKHHSASFELMGTNFGVPKISLIAFVEPPVPGKSIPIQLQIYIVNESKETYEILNDLNSINIPEGLQNSNEKGHDADMVHIDFGMSEEATFIKVASGECLRITLLLREEHMTLLERVRRMKTTVKFKTFGDKENDVTTIILSSGVYRVNS